MRRRPAMREMDERCKAHASVTTRMITLGW